MGLSINRSKGVQMRTCYINCDCRFPLYSMSWNLRDTLWQSTTGNGAVQTSEMGY